MTDSTSKNTRRLLQYVLRESDILRSLVLILAIAAAASRTALIFFINETAERGGASFWMFAVLLGISAAMLIFMHWSKMAGVVLVQRLARKMREEVTDLMLRADVSFFQKRDAGVIHNHTTANIDLIANATTRIAELVQAVLLLIFVLGYMFWQMPASVLATVVALVFGVCAFFLNEGPATKSVKKLQDARVKFYNSLQDLLRGYKELRLRKDRRKDISEQISKHIEDVQQHSTVAERHYSFGFVTANGAMSALLIAIVVILPLVGDADSVTVLQVLTLALFSFGPIEAMVSSLPALARAAVSFNVYDTMKSELLQKSEHPDPTQSDRDLGFETIELRDVSVVLTRDVGDTAHAKDSFTLGPINLTLTPGQSVFITGGNGMGKSTLLGLLTGLRHPDSGEIFIDGTSVTKANVSTYRGVFSAVFSEFYLFRHLYGLTDAEIEELQHYIQEMGLGDGVVIENKAFTNLDLSTGQMRRLALSIALAEKRPVIILDEFAADQDPTRRAFFYDTLVPRLAAAGHCVVAVTHDEHCFDKADRLIRMEDGKIVSDTLQTNQASKAK